MARRGVGAAPLLALLLAMGAAVAPLQAASLRRGEVAPSPDEDPVDADLAPDVSGCPLPDGWCRHVGAKLKKVDCDGDERADWVCTDAQGNRGAVTSARGCDPAATGWPHAAKRMCAKHFGGPEECEQPEDWCIHPGSVVTRVHCDGDNTLDLVCTDSEGSRGVLRSTSVPACDSEQDGWSLAPVSYCPGYFKELPACPRPGWWCNGTYATLEKMDCDGDTMSDWVCSDDRGRRGAILSSQNCGAWDGATGWPAADASYCPDFFKGPPCLRPEWWCVQPEQTLTLFDCNNDGEFDYVCEDKVKGERGVMISNKECNPFENGTLWPHAPASRCPGYFKDVTLGEAQDTEEM